MNNIEQFNPYRPLLFSIAYRMLGSQMEAEDMVQESFLRWQTVSTAEVQSVKAYLTSIITRLCIDHLRSARVQRETYVGSWLPEPLIADQPPGADRPVVLAESLSMAFLVLLERLTPIERAVFLLREVFDYDYPEIAAIVDKSEANCRQLVRRARQHISAHRPRFDATPEQQQRLTMQFMETCGRGDMSGLLNLLADDITVWSDGGGKVTAARRPIVGPERVAHFFISIIAKAPPGLITKAAWINDQPGIISYFNGQAVSVLIFDIAEERIQTIYAVINPDKLQKIPV
ncbi:MAG: RNA polymerase sigma-70 factor [Anaerolineaceae bacterium]|nr:RNA polymerase sigma-70 factor [Anaerolineaceae bacterium]MCB9101185.1 RNA polymerase sigma-70 factor [Anaerolineales bacterium]